MSNVHAHIGISKVAEFRAAPKFVETMSTSFLKPCIALVMFNKSVSMGAVNHLRVRFRSTDQDVYESVESLKDTGFDPADTNVALVGGNDIDVPEDRSIQTSRRMAQVVKEALDEYGFSVDHEDLFGSHQRRLVLDSQGTLRVDDDWKENESIYPYTVEL